MVEAEIEAASASGWTWLENMYFSVPLTVEGHF